jgi:hypothetical protein
MTPFKLKNLAVKFEMKVGDMDTKLTVNLSDPDVHAKP